MRFYHFALALLMASAAQASLLPSNFFTNPESPTSDHAHRRASSGRDVGSPFGSGCVGTDPLCAMSLSSADRSERATSHRDIAPELWQVKEDIEWEKNQRAALPGARLESFLTRLGGKDSWQQKLSWSQRELLRRQIEDEARFRAEKLANEKLRQLEHDEEEADRLRSLNWRQRLFVTPTYSEAKPLFTVRADRDVTSPRMTMRKLTRKERDARVDWHKGLRDRFTHPLDADPQDFVDRFNPDVLEFEGVKLVSFKKRDGRKRLDK